jgi:bifunctional ADP-heptose synthase (sugar kinase/adenylyltransferase)
MNITILGHVCIDSNISEHSSYTGAGSPAMFMAKIYQQFPGVSTQIIAPYGKDFLPYLKNVSIYPDKPTGEKTLVYKNLSQGAIRTQKALNREYTELLPITENLQELIASSDVLFLAPLTSDYSIQYVNFIMKSVKKETLKVLLPQGYYRSFDSENNVHQREFKEAEAMLPLFDFVIVSEQDHFAINEFARDWIRHTRVIVTRGDKGAVYYHDDKTLVVPTKPVHPDDIIDSVGSGDIFSASFGYKYFETKDIQKSLEFANNIARQCLFYKADSLKIILL